MPDVDLRPSAATGELATPGVVDTDRREQILEAALDVFAEHGFAAATIKRIATAAGLKSPALLYWYFPNKEDLFVSVLIRFAPTATDDLVGDPDLLDQPPEVVLPLVIEHFLAHFDDPRTVKVFRVLLLEVPLLQAHGFNLRDSDLNGIYAFIERYVRHQIEIGALRLVDPVQVARLIIAVLSFNVHSRSSGLFDPPPPDEQFVADTVSILLDGLRA